MSLLIEVASYVLASIMIGVSGTWIWLIRSMIESHTKTPCLEDFKEQTRASPMISVILPARNEEKYIEACLDSLVKQDYENYEIIAIDDSSEDNTGKMIAEYAKKYSKIIHVTAKPKPDGWMGKNWACMQGYKKATGKLLLFTDSDTKHAPNLMSLAVGHLTSENLDALTVIPRMLCMEFWTKVTLPMISTFLHTRFSALRVNDPTKKTGYFFGSFFVIKKETYDGVGMHEGVKEEIIEDGALGKKVKESGYKMRMVQGDTYIDAIWARDLPTLWHALKRLMVPLYLQSSKIAVGIFFAVLFLLFAPFALISYSTVLFEESLAHQILFAASLVASCVIYAGAVIETRILRIGTRYATWAPLGSLVIVMGFAGGLIHAKSNSAVSWRGRSYSMKDHPQSSIKI